MKERIKSIKHTPVTCSCSIEYGLYVTGVPVPERIISRCRAHEHVEDVESLRALTSRENWTLNDARVQIQFSGARLASPPVFDVARRLVLVVADATESLRQALARMDGVLPRFVD